MKTCYIIGKGPSLEYLNESHFGEGIIITINQAILAIEKLNIKNKVFSMQKDGAPGYNNKCPSLDCPKCPFGRTYPICAGLLVHTHESIQCMPDYPKREIFDNTKLGLKIHDYSALSAIRYAQSLGYDYFKFLCFDAVTERNYLTHIPDKGTIKERYFDNYRIQAIHMLNFLIEHKINYEFITPKIV